MTDEQSYQEDQPSKQNSTIEKNYYHVYEWVDNIPLSKNKRNFARDFSDGSLVAEIVKHYHPKLIDLHNTPASLKLDRKRKNWELLNEKVFKRLNFTVSDSEIDKVIRAVPLTAEVLLDRLCTKLMNPSEKPKGYLQCIESK